MLDVFIFDTKNAERNLLKLRKQFPHAKEMRFYYNHLEMLTKAAAKAKTEYFWAISSCCDYRDFDFEWMPPRGQEKQLHTWASGYQGQGDTFLVNTEEFIKQSRDLDKLAYYQDVNYHKANIERFPWPVVNIEHNDLMTQIPKLPGASPYVEVRVDSTWNADMAYPSLWEANGIVAMNKQGSVSYVPIMAKTAFNRQIYDWPYIQYLDSKKTLEKPQDVVFISYDEENAEENFKILQKKCLRAKRIHGVKGLSAALKAAADLAETTYFYAVFGKTRIDPGFEFDYKVDRLRSPANYVFLAQNKTIDHTYGHGAVVLHNRRLLLNTSYPDDVDLTTYHDVVTVPIISCTIEFADEWEAWRTAFRETFKLTSIVQKSIDDEYNLSKWLTCNPTGLGKWALRGAHDAWQLNGASRFEVKLNDWSYLKGLFEQAKEKMDESSPIQA